MNESEMKPSDWNKLFITLTVCFCTLIWGTMVVNRGVVDRNYHTPTPAQLRVDALKDCSASPAKSEDCRKILEVK